MDFFTSIAVIMFVIFVLHKCCGGKKKSNLYPDLKQFSNANNSLLKLYNVRHVNAIVDQFRSLDEVTSAIRRAGLESSNLIFGVDYTASNQHQGMKTFGGKSLHHMGLDNQNPYQQFHSILTKKQCRTADHMEVYLWISGIDYTISNMSQGSRTFQGRCLHDLRTEGNPYQQVIRILGHTLSPFDDDGLIPAFGFGDLSSKDKTVFPFRTEGFCTGFEDVLDAYNQITANVKMSGPTNFAPMIYQAIEIVKQTRQYHILVIVADGQVTSEAPTRKAIVEASKWPLSIILIGVGDGPWEMMQEFDDDLPTRKFDNFQFVDYNRVLTFGTKPDTSFALHALMEIPDQYKQIRKLGLLDF